MAPCTRPTRVAAIVVGLVHLDGDRGMPRVADDFAGHLSKLANTTLEPTNADVFAVYEVGRCCDMAGGGTGASSCSDASCHRAMDDALLRIVGPRVRGIGVVTRKLPPGASPASTLDAGSGRPPVAKQLLQHGRNYGNSKALHQWYKVQEGWRLMVAEESRAGAQFDAVLKLRFDILAAPRWQLCSERDGLHAAAPRMLHVMTDMVFWGRRDVMEIACGLYGRHVYYEAKAGATAALRRPRDAEKPIAVRAHLSSLLAQPLGLFTERIKYYSKFAHLWVPEMGGDDAYVSTPGVHPAGLLDARRGMCQNLLRALAAGWEWLDPLAPRAHQPAVRVHEAYKGRAGARQWRDGHFWTEHHFLHWLMIHNVTVCDLGAGVTHVDRLGHSVVTRQGRDDCLSAIRALPPPRAGGPSAESAGSIVATMRRMGIREDELCSTGDELATRAPV